jgi:hypothetical protein
LLDELRQYQLARGTVHNLAEAARQNGVRDQLLAEAMILKGWMLITGATEREAQEAIRQTLSAKLRSTH